MNSSSGEPAERPRDFVGATVHVVNVLKAFDAAHPQMTLSDVAKRVDLDRAGARRYLLSLVHLGYIAQDGKLFRLTPKVLELGYAFLSTLPLPEIAQSYLESITRRIDETSGIAILDGNHIVHVAKAYPNRLYAPTITVGRVFNALYTSTGRVLIACKSEAEMQQHVSRGELRQLTPVSITDRTQLLLELKKISNQGYAVVDQEVEEGFRSIAIPVLDANDQAVAAVNVLTSVGTVPKKRLTEDFLPVLREYVGELQGALKIR